MSTQGQGIVQLIRENRDEFILLGFIAVVAVYVLVETRDLLPGTRQVPLLIAILMAVVLGMTVIMKLFGEGIRSRLGWAQAETGFYLDSDIDDDDQGTEHLYDLNPKRVAKHFLWLSLYIVSLVYVGFWTTNIVFPFVYIMLYETSPLPRRFLYFALWTGLIVGTLWILFVELLRVQAIWRLGFLP